MNRRRHLRFVTAFLAAFAVGLGGLAAVNLAVDADGLFDHEHRLEREVARILGSGRDMATTGNFQAPLVNHLLIDGWEKTPEVVATGSSRVLEVSADMAPGRRFFNHGGTSSRLAHVLAVLGAYERRGEQPGTILITAEHWLFSHETISETTMTGAMDDLRLMAGRLGTTPAAVGVTSPSLASTAKALVSLSLARRSLALVRDSHAVGGCPVLEERGDDRTPCPVKRRDGSFKYPEAVEQASPRDVAARLSVGLGQRGGLYMAEGIDRIDETRVAVFEALLRYLQGRGSRVVVMLSPFHPLVASAPKHSRDWANVRHVEQLIRQIAARTGVEVRGSYDAHQAGCDETDFYDDVHPRHACIARILGDVLAR